jgi:6-phosphogluconolactonase
MDHNFPARLAVFLCVLTFACFAHANENGLSRFWIASSEDGIYTGELSRQTGKVENLFRSPEASGASYIAKHPSKNVLYAVSRTEGGSKLSSYLIQENGTLTLQSALDKRPEGGAHINVSNDGLWLAVAYYSSGVTGVYKLEQDGRIEDVYDEAQHTGSSVNPERQTTSHPHWAGFSSDSQFLYVPDLGTDHIWVYEIDEENFKLRVHQKAATARGAGPRHLAFHSTLNFAYVSDELQAQVSRYVHDPKSGKLTYVDSMISSEEASEDSWHNVSDIRVHPGGNFLYLVNRGFDYVSVFGINSLTGELKPIEREAIRGSISRNINFDESGRWALVAGTGSNTLSVFAVDLASGDLQFREVLSVPSPMAIVF